MFAMNFVSTVILTRLNFRYSGERTEGSYRSEKEILRRLRMTARASFVTYGMFSLKILWRVKSNQVLIHSFL
jgi:hypothetical protein